MSEHEYENLSLKKFVERAEAWNEGVSDTKVSSQNLRALSGNTISMPVSNTPVKGDLHYPLPLNDHALAQMCERLGVPARWVQSDNCPDELAKTVLDWKFKNGEMQKWLVRSHENGEITGRAVMSDQYTPYDHFDFATAVASAVKEGGIKADVFRPEIGDTMRAYILIREMQFDAGDPRDGGGLFPGIYISNSEIGTGKARVNGGLYQSVCDNGMILGWQQKESTELIHRWDAKAHMAVKINEAIASGLKMAEQAAIRFLDAQALTLDLTKLDKIVEGWAKKYGVLSGSRDSILGWNKAMRDTSAEPSAFEFVSVITAHAQNIESTDQRERMEAMAGGLLMADLPRA